MSCRASSALVARLLAHFAQPLLDRGLAWVHPRPGERHLLLVPTESGAGRVARAVERQSLAHDIEQPDFGTEQLVFREGEPYVEAPLTEQPSKAGEFVAAQRVGVGQAARDMLLEEDRRIWSVA